MRKLAISLLMSMLFVAANAQEQEGDITIQKSFGGLKFYQERRILKPREVLNIMEPNPEAFKTFKKAKANYDAANVFGFISGFMIGWPLGTALEAANHSGYCCRWCCCIVDSHSALQLL